MANWDDWIIHGERDALSAIVDTPSSIALHRSDIIRVLDCVGDNYLVVGEGPTISAAITNVSIPPEMGVATKMAVALWCGAAEFKMRSMSNINEQLAKFGSPSEIIWGIYDEPSLRNWFRICILASCR